MNRPMNIVIVVLCAISVVGCQSWRDRSDSPGQTSGFSGGFWSYLKTKILPDEPHKQISYEMKSVRADIPPEVIIEFERNGWTLNEAAYDQLDAIVSDDRDYLIEGTAGGLTRTALKLWRKRTHAVIEYLEAQGINPKRLFIVNYDPDKRGRQARIYTITE